jgi:hypothetical protein
LRYSKSGLNLPKAEAEIAAMGTADLRKHRLVVKTSAPAVLLLSAFLVCLIVFFHLKERLSKREDVVALSAPVSSTQPRLKIRRDPNSASNLRADRTHELQGQLEIGKPLERENAIVEIKRLAEGVTERTKAADRITILNLLLESKQYTLAESLASDTIFRMAESSSVVSDAESVRVRAMMEEGHYDSALCEAKSNFNVSTLKTSMKALYLLKDAIQHVQGEDGVQSFEKLQDVDVAPIVSASGLQWSPELSASRRRATTRRADIRDYPFDYPFG